MNFRLMAIALQPQMQRRRGLALRRNAAYFTVRSREEKSDRIRPIRAIREIRGQTL